VSFLIFHHREDGGFHAVVEKRVAFGHVDDVEFHIGSFGDISSAEEEPLVVAFGVYVVL
jgi:hypothetical protein